MSRLSDNGRYILGDPLGSGGQGVVFEARQLDLDRRVAIKQFEAAGVIEHEARLLAALRHPNLLQVYELIQVDQQPALVLELIDGPDLATLMGQADIDPEVALSLWLAIVDGLAHAHQHGVVHGDLSPFNVLVAVDGARITPKICDFGVGRSERNPVGQVGGTEGFLAPERRNGSGPTTQADVYSVAVLGRFLMPRDCPPDVDTLLSVAMSPDPSARPRDAGELSARLRDLGATTPSDVVVGPSSPHRGLSLPLGVALGMALASLGFVVWFRPAANDTVDPTLALAAMQHLSSHPAQAAALWHAAGSTPSAQARALGADSRVLPQDVVITDMAAGERHLLTADANGLVREWDPFTGRVLRQLPTGVQHPVGLATHDDLITMAPHGLWGENPSHCVAWSLQSGDCRVQLDDRVIHQGVRLSVDGKYLWYALKDQSYGVVDLHTGVEQWRRPYANHIRTVVRDDVPDEFGLFLDDALFVVQWSTGEHVLMGEGLPKGDFGAVWNPDGIHWATRSEILHLPPEGAMTQTPSVGHALSESPLGFAHAGGRSRIGTIHTPQGPRSIRHRGWTTPVAWGGPFLLATSASDGPIAVTDVRTGHVQRVLYGHDASLTDLVVVGEWLASSSMDRTIRLWRPRDSDAGWLRRLETDLTVHAAAMGQQPVVLGRQPDDQWAVWSERLGHQTLGPADIVGMAPGGQFVATGTEDGRLTVVQLSDGAVHSWDAPTRGARCIRLDPERDRLLLGRSRDYHVYRLSDGGQVDSQPLPPRSTGCPSIDFQGEIWFMAATEPYLISSEGQRPSVPFDGTVAGVLPHPNALVIRGFDGELAIARDEDLELIDTRTSTHAVTDDRVGWATMDGRVHASGPSAWSSSPGSRVHAMTWAAGDALLLAGRASGVLDAWTRSGRKVASVQAHDARIISLMVQPSNGHIVSVDVDGVVQWWEPSRLTGEEVPLVTNYRTCSGTQQVVPVVPFPTPETRWAPAQHCEAR